LSVPGGDGPNAGLDWGVVLVVEQLRRAVPGGIGRYARAVIGGLASLAGAERPRCRLYASRAGADPDPLEGLGFPVLTSGWPGAALVRAWSAGFGRIGYDASLVHAFSFAFPPAAAPLTVSVYDLAWRSVPDAFSARGRRFHERALRRVAGQAACAVVPSEATARALCEAGVGLGEDRIAVVEAGADHLPPADFSALGELLARLGVAGDYLLAVGTLEPRKNLARLFAAYAISRRQQAERLPLVVVGPAGWGKSVAACEGVVFAGHVAGPVLSALYARARLVAYVPLLEGFGLPVVEAMRAGVPVVASRVPAAGGAAYEVDPCDVESIAEGLTAVGGDEATRARLVAAGRARVAPLTWRAAAENHLALWRRVVGGGS
jgi:glycosyltransferase involved in cell wall biosynthesis